MKLFSFICFWVFAYQCYGNATDRALVKNDTIVFNLGTTRMQFGREETEETIKIAESMKISLICHFALAIIVYFTLCQSHPAMANVMKMVIMAILCIGFGFFSLLTFFVPQNAYTIAAIQVLASFVTVTMVQLLLFALSVYYLFNQSYIVQEVVNYVRAALRHLVCVRPQELHEE